VEFIVVTAKIVVGHYYPVLCVEFIVVTATVDIVKWYCVVCGVYCGYSNSRYSEMVLCCVWSLLWLQQQYVLGNITNNICDKQTEIA